MRPGTLGAEASRLANARRLRFAIVLILLAVLAWVLFSVLEREVRRVEEQSVALVLSQLRSALVIKGAEVMLGGNDSLADYQGINPVALATQHWRHYQGRCQGGGPDSGNWCFWARERTDSRARETGWLIYNPRQPITIDGWAEASGALRAWSVTTDFVDHNGNGRREREERLTGLRLSPAPLPGALANVPEGNR